MRLFHRIDLSGEEPDPVSLRLRAECEQAKAARALETIPHIIERDEGYIHGLERAIEIAEGRA